MTIQSSGFPSQDFDLAPVPLQGAPWQPSNPCLGVPAPITCDPGPGYGISPGGPRRWIPESPGVRDGCRHDAPGYPRPGDPYDLRTGQRIVDQSGGRLTWAQDGRGDWWIVDRRNRDDVERTGRCCDTYDGPGVRMLDRRLKGYPAGEQDAEWFNRTGRRFAGPGDYAHTMLRPDVDQWTSETGQRLAEQSGGALSLAQDARGNWYLIATQDEAAFERLYGGRVLTPEAPGGRAHDFTVRQSDLNWINAVMGGAHREHEHRRGRHTDTSELVTVMVAQRWTR